MRTLLHLAILTIVEATHFYGIAKRDYPLTTAQAHDLLTCMGLDIERHHLADFARRHDVVLAQNSQTSLWHESDIMRVAELLAERGKLTAWAARWRFAGVPLRVAEEARAAAWNAHPDVPLRQFDIWISNGAVRFVAPDFVGQSTFDQAKLP